jgi:Mrp family chromosome partitioning ATPase
MKHFAVSAPVGRPIGRPAGGAASDGPARAFEPDGEDRMTQQGFKRFRRRNRQSTSDQAADQRPEPAAEPFLDRGYQPEPEAEFGQENTAPAAKPAAAVEDVPVTGRRRRPLNLAAQSRVDIIQPPMEVLPTRFDPWNQIEQIPFDFGGPKASRLPLVSAFRASPTARAFDLLRTRLLHSLNAHGWSRVAVTSPRAGGGTTFGAVNLALSLARVPESRSLLMDMNFRQPGVAQALGIAPHGNMAAFLAQKATFDQHLQRLSDTLAVGSNSAPDQNASDLLHDPRAAAAIADMIEATSAETVLFDLPPVLEHDDVAAFLPQVDGVLLISDGTRTTAAELAACEKMLAGHAPLLGVVLNRAE